MIEPIVVEISVAATPDHAFEVWTTRCGIWWPTSHRMAEAKSEIVFETSVGGRIYEVEPDGTEHDWGRITEWDPPRRLAYTWHIFLDPEKATTVEVSFTSEGDHSRVRMVNSGFEIFGEEPGRERAGRVHSAWESIISGYRDVFAG